MKQVTLNQSFSVQGKGLHTGARLQATFCPAPEITDISSSVSTSRANP